jgi:hypothetical protein
MLLRAVTETKSKSSDRLALVVGVVVALALFAWGVSSVYSSVMLDVRGVEADGNVDYASFSRGTAEHPNDTACALTIELPDAGQTHLRVNGADSTTCAGLVHTSLRVRYEPGNPENVRLAANGGLIVDIAVLATLAAALFVLVRVLRWAVQRIRKIREDAKSSGSR